MITHVWRLGVDASRGALLVVTAIGAAATAFGRGFRRYSSATIVVMLVFAAWAVKDAGRIEAGLATPWAGVMWPSTALAAWL